jgi:hypothetical protein
MRSRTPAWPALVLGSACLLVAGRASAQSADPAAADALFQKGREAAEKGEWAVACQKFAESQRLDPAVGTLLNLADCEEHLGKLASAHEHFRTAIETLAPGDDRIPFAKKHAAELEKSVPHVTLSPPPDFPEGGKVMRDEVQLGAASFGLPLPVNPGSHVIVVSAPGHADKRLTVTLKAGESETVPLTLGPVVVEPPTTPSHDAADATTAPQSGASGMRTAGFVVGGVGLVGLGVGAVTGLMVLGKKSTVDDPTHCDPTTHVCDQAGLDAASSGKTLSTVSTVAFVAGGALLVTGAVLVLTGGHAAPASAVAVGPETYAGGGAGLRVIHAF